MNEILKIILQRNKERKLLTKNDVKRICELIAKANKLDNIQYVDFEKGSVTDPYTAGECHKDHITFYSDGIDKIIEEDSKDITSVHHFDGCKVDIYNFIYLSVIFHEFAHVKQNDMIDKRYNNLEGNLFYICDKLMNIKNFYNDNYQNFLTEVNAFAKGSSGAYNLYHQFPKDYLTDNDRTGYASFAFDEIIDSYTIDPIKEKVISPSELLLHNAECFNLSLLNVDIDRFKKLIFNNQDVTIYRKLMLGLPLSFMEYAYANLLDDAVHAGQDIDFLKKLQKKM